MINSPKWDYNATTNTISFQGVDLMAALTGLRNGYLPGLPVTIPQGSSVKEVMTAILNDFTGFKRSVISECVNVDGSIQEVPYDIEIDGDLFKVIMTFKKSLKKVKVSSKNT